MNKKLYLIILLLTCKICVSQNLVLNGDFEQYLSCPNGTGYVDSVLFWHNPFVTLVSSSDYFNQCATVSSAGVPENLFGYQYAQNGLGYCGIHRFYKPQPNYREYIEGTLSMPLASGTSYHFEMYMNLSNRCKYTASDIGVYFSDSLITGLLSTPCLLPYVPQINNTSGNIPDTLTWNLITGDFTAAGGEKFLIIGSFNDDSLTDTILYNTQGNLNGAYVYIDNVSLTPSTGIGAQNQITKMKVYPSPFTDKIIFKNQGNELSEIILYDISSRKLLQQKFTNSVSLNTEQLAKGIYLYEVRNKSGVIQQGKVVKD